MKRCVIVGGAEIRDYERARAALRPDDCCVFCDSGLKHMDGLGVKPDLIVGDFDSHEDPRMDVETIVLPRAKDDTDTVFAAKEMMKRGFGEFLLVGVIGDRLDHTLANLSILLMLDTAGKKAKAIDDFSEMEILSAGAGAPGRISIEDRYSYFSLLNISGVAEGITIRGARFPLEDGRIDCDYQYAVSNEVLPGQAAEVTIREGRVLVVKDV